MIYHLIQYKTRIIEQFKTQCHLKRIVTLGISTCQVEAINK